MMVLCQGNGSAPQIWTIISSIVLSALRAQVFGIHFPKYFVGNSTVSRVQLRRGLQHSSIVR